MTASSSREEFGTSVPVSRPQKQASLIARRIVRDIDQRGLREGDRLPSEREMLEMYNVGRGTLREALRVLELHGVLTLRPGRGGGPVITAPDSRHLATALALIMQFSETTFGSVIEVRRHLEPITAGMCAERSPADLLDTIAASVERMSANTDNAEIFLEENRRFHDLVAWGSGNALFGHFISSLHWITDGTPLGVVYTPQLRKITASFHEEIYFALRQRDPEKSRAAMLNHMEHMQTFFERGYPDVFDQRLGWEYYGDA